MAEWSSGQRVGLASGGPGFEFYSDHLLLDLFSIVTSSNSSVTNWLSPASWGFKSRYFLFEFFATNYLRAVNMLDKLSVLSYKTVFFDI